MGNKVSKNNGYNQCLKFPVDHQQSVKYNINTLWPVCTVTSSKDRWIGTNSIGLTILGKLSCPNNKNKKKKNVNRDIVNKEI